MINDTDFLIEQVRDITNTWDEMENSLRKKLARRTDLLEMQELTTHILLHMVLMTLTILRMTMMTRLKQTQKLLKHSLIQYKDLIERKTGMYDIIYGVLLH